MLAVDAAEELARRLSGLRLGGFSVRGNQVLRPGEGFDVPLTLVCAGRGRPYEVEQALRKSETIEAPVLFAEAFWPGGLDLMERAQANYSDQAPRESVIGVPSHRACERGSRLSGDRSAGVQRP